MSRDHILGGMGSSGGKATREFANIATSAQNAKPAAEKPAAQGPAKPAPVSGAKSTSNAPSTRK